MKMADNVNQTDSRDGVRADGGTPERYKLKVATNVVPMQRDHLGRKYWESYQTPDS
jgi:hypothetical protein